MKRHEQEMAWLLTTVTTAATDSCIDWPYRCTLGAGYGSLYRDGQATGAHRVACEIAHGLPPSTRHEAAHYCGRRVCVNPRHLRWATHTENIADRLSHGTSNRGEQCGTHKLSIEDVREIRRLWGAGAERWTQRGLAGRFGVKQNTISAIVNRRSWAWLD